jgi:hypothetical protein
MRYDSLCSWIPPWLLVFWISAALDPRVAIGLVILPLPRGRPSSFRCARELHKSRRHTSLDQNNDGSPSDSNTDDPPLNVSPLMALALEQSLFQVQTLMNMSDNDSEHGAWSHLMKNCRESVQLGPSSQPGAGKGLMARKDLDQGALVSFYPVHGIGLGNLGWSRVAIASSNDMDQAYFDNDDRQHGQQCGHNYRQYLIHDDRDINPILSSLSLLFIDVNPNRAIQNGWMSHCINDGAAIIRHDTMLQGDGIVEYYTSALAAQNCVQIPFGPSPLMATVTTSPVEKGKELFTCYGSAFWLAKTGGHKPAMDTPAIAQQQQCVKLAASKTRSAIEHARTTYNKELECVYSLWDRL